ncbi:MAG TPA: polyphenol oxidase family protein [Acidimicrobiales bacterium]|nr:polyphenol oxidase family protein [Acidimicrobiales bacterium]
MRRQVHPGGVCTWHFDLDGPGVLAAVTTRHGGASTGPYRGLNLAYHVGDDPDRVAGNRRLLCRALGVATVTVPDQQHGCRVAVVDGDLAGAGYRSDDDARARLPATDALVTDQPGVALGVLMADCGPVVLFDPGRPALAVVHSGRRGAVLDVVGAAVRTLQDRFGTDPADLRAGVGPCIGPASYEIGGDALADTADALGDRFLAPSRPGHAHFDLPGALRWRLLQAGVPDRQVEMAAVDTYRSTADLFSDRAARPCGRIMLLAALRRGVRPADDPPAG